MSRSSTLSDISPSIRAAIGDGSRKSAVSPQELRLRILRGGSRSSPAQTPRRATTPTIVTLGSPDNRSSPANATSPRRTVQESPRRSLRAIMSFGGRLAVSELEAQLEMVEKKALEEAQASASAQLISEEKILNLAESEKAVQGLLEEETQLRLRLQSEMTGVETTEAECRTEVAQLTSSVARLRDEADSFKEESEELRVEASKLKAWGAEEASECRKLNAVLSLAQSERVTAMDAFSAREETDAHCIKELMAEIDRLSSEQVREKQLSKLGETEREGMQSELQRGASRISVLEGDLASATEALRRQAATMDSLQAQYHDSDQRWHDAEALCERYKAEAAAVEVETGLKTAEFEALEQHVDDTQERLCEAQHEAEELAELVSVLNLEAEHVREREHQASVDRQLDRTRWEEKEQRLRDEAAEMSTKAYDSLEKCSIVTKEKVQIEGELARLKEDAEFSHQRQVQHAQVIGAKDKVIADLTEALVEQRLRNNELTEENAHFRAQIPIHAKLKEDFLAVEAQKLADWQDWCAKEQCLRVEMNEKDLEHRTEVGRLTTEWTHAESESAARASRESTALRLELSSLAETVKELHPLVQRCSTLEQEKAASSQEAQAACVEKQDLRALLESSQAQVRSLTKQVDLGFGQLADERTRGSTLENTLRVVREELDAKTVSVTELRRSMAEKDARIRRRTQAHADAQAQCKASAEEIQAFGRRSDEWAQREAYTQREMQRLHAVEADLLAMSESLAQEKNHMRLHYEQEVRTLNENAACAALRASEELDATCYQNERERAEIMCAGEAREEAHAADMMQLRASYQEEFAACKRLQQKSAEHDNMLKILRTECAQSAAQCDKSERRRIELQGSLTELQDRYVTTKKALTEECAELTRQLRGLAKTSDRRDKELATLLMNPRMTPRASPRTASLGPRPPMKL